MARLSRGFIPKCPIFKPTTRGMEECLAERSNMRFIVTRYKNGRLNAVRVPNRGYSITKARQAGRLMPVATPPTFSLDHLLDEAVRFMRRVDKPRA